MDIPEECAALDAKVKAIIDEHGREITHTELREIVGPLPRLALTKSLSRLILRRQIENLGDDTFGPLGVERTAPRAEPDLLHQGRTELLAKRMALHAARTLRETDHDDAED